MPAQVPIVERNVAKGVGAELSPPPDSRLIRGHDETAEVCVDARAAGKVDGHLHDMKSLSVDALFNGCAGRCEVRHRAGVDDVAKAGRGHLVSGDRAPPARVAVDEVGGRLVER